VRVFVPTRVLVLVVFLFCISYVINITLWVQDFNKLTYLPTCVLVLVVFLFCISYVITLTLWVQDFNKLTYLLTNHVRKIGL